MLRFKEKSMLEKEQQNPSQWIFSKLTTQKLISLMLDNYKAIIQCLLILRLFFKLFFTLINWLEYLGWRKLSKIPTWFTNVFTAVNRLQTFVDMIKLTNIVKLLIKGTVFLPSHGRKAFLPTVDIYQVINIYLLVWLWQPDSLCNGYKHFPLVSRSLSKNNKEAKGGPARSQTLSGSCWTRLLHPSEH